MGLVKTTMRVKEKIFGSIGKGNLVLWCPDH